MAHCDSPEALSRICHRLVSGGRAGTVRGYGQLPTWSNIHQGHSPHTESSHPSSQGGGRSKASGPDAMSWGIPRVLSPWAHLCGLLSMQNWPSGPAMSSSVPRFSGTQVTCPAS